MKTLSGVNRKSGQAIIEYVLLLSIILGIAGLLVGSIRSTRDKMWKQIMCEVSAECPTCTATDSAKSALPKSGVNCKY